MQPKKVSKLIIRILPFLSMYSKRKVLMPEEQFLIQSGLAWKPHGAEEKGPCFSSFYIVINVSFPLALS
jgi:hypothetical protein